MSDTKPILEILDLGNGNFDFEKIPQGYVHVCCTGIPKTKGMRKHLVNNGCIINPTHEQVIAYAKLLMSRSDMYGESSGKIPDDYEIIIVSNREPDKKLWSEES